MTKDQIQSLVASYLYKQSEEGPAHEAAETPNAEMLEHAMGVGGGEQPHGAGPGGVDVEQLLSQLSPEELQELISQLSAGGGAGGAGAPPPGGDDVAGLSQNIESHLAQNPEAQVPEAAPEKMAALNLVKSAQYIEGFIKQALDHGFNVNDAVTMYDNALTTTVDELKKEAYSQKNLTAPKGLMHKTRVGFNKLKARAENFGSRTADKIKEHEGFKKLKEHGEKGLKTIKDNPKTSAGVGAAALGAGGYAAYKASDKEKKAAYLEGIFKQAMAYGLSEAEAYEVVKEAGVKEMYEGSKNYLKGKGKQIGDYARSKRKQIGDYASSKGKELKSKADDAWYSVAQKAYDNPGKTLGAAAGVAGLAGGAGYLAGKSSDKEKKAAFIEGVYKQAMARGFSEEDAIQVAQQAAAQFND